MSAQTARPSKRLGKRSKVSINGLASVDDILAIVADDAEEQERARSDTENGQIWIKLETDWTDKLRSETLISSARFTNGRQGIEDDPAEIVGYVDDMRTLDVHGLKQDWAWLLSDRHVMNWGFEVERLSAAYRYASSVDLFGFSASFDGVSSSVRRNITMFPTSRTYSLHVSDRISFGSSAVAEFGLRWDKQTHLPTERNENQLSPRLSFLYQLGPRSNLRASWGRYFQSQGLLQLQVEDGVREFFPAQSAKHYIVSLEHRLRNDRCRSACLQGYAEASELVGELHALSRRRCCYRKGNTAELGPTSQIGRWGRLVRGEVGIFGGCELPYGLAGDRTVPL